MEKNNLILILGNGLSIDLLNHLNCNKENIDLVNLFSKGDTVFWPDGLHERGFLSYKHCPSLWSLGARPNIKNEEANELIENIITCANIVCTSNLKGLEENIYISAYYELVWYLKHLFIKYNEEIDDNSLKKLKDWGWLNLLKKAYYSDRINKIFIITYNYDIFLERLLQINELDFSIGGIEENNKKILIMKPHGSISFIHKKCNDPSNFQIRKGQDMYDAEIKDFSISYKELDKNYLINALIPPAGDSSRMSFKWASDIRKIIDENIDTITENDKCIISGLSYWHVDRKEIDSLLAKIGHKNIDTFMVNPYPPKALSAVLTCVLPKNITYFSSKWIGGIINE